MYCYVCWPGLDGVAGILYVMDWGIVSPMISTWDAGKKPTWNTSSQVFPDSKGKGKGAGL